MLNQETIWYAGPVKDGEKAKNGKNIVLMADEQICRILSYQSGKYMVHGYFAPTEIGILAFSKNKQFQFDGKQYLVWPSYFYCSSSSKKKLLEWYKELCETPEDNRIEIFKQTWLHNRKLSSKDNGFPDSMTLDGIVEQVEQTGSFDACFTLCLVTEVGALGTIDIKIIIEKSKGGVLPYSVTSFDKLQVIEEAVRIVRKHGFDIPEEDISSVIDSILAELSRVLKNKGIDFIDENIPF